MHTEQDQTIHPAGNHRRLKLTNLAAVLLLLVLGFGTAARTFAQDNSSSGSGGSTNQSSQTASSSTSTVAGLSVADVAAQVNPAVVTITNVTDSASGPNAFFGQGGAEMVAMGSGFIIDDQGDIITNAHVVDGATKLSVAFSDGSTADAKLVGEDTFQDIAVIKAELKNGAKVPGVATLGDDSSLRPGDPVVALGTPLGEFPNTVTDGIVGGVKRSLDTGEGYRLPNLIQHDAPISPGNSGGPLVDMSGKVVGVNVAKAEDNNNLDGATAEGLGFAISIDAAKNVADQLIKNGSVTYPYLGIDGQLTDQGQAVADIASDSPAAKAGLKAGDIITAVDGTNVDPNNPLVNLLFAHKPGDSVKLTIDRDGTSKEISVTLGERPANLQ